MFKTFLWILYWKSNIKVKLKQRKNLVPRPGTLHQLRILVNRRNVGKDVRLRYHAVADFIDMVTDSHVLAAAMSFLDMTSAEVQPDAFPKHIAIMSRQDRKLLLHHLVGQIIDHFIQVKYKVVNDQENVNDVQDHVHNYATNLMTYGLLRKVSIMTTAAGDHRW